MKPQRNIYQRLPYIACNPPSAAAIESFRKNNQMFPPSWGVFYGSPQMQVPTWLHRRASSRICHETILRVEKEKILGKQSDKGWSSIQESSQHLVLLPYPTDKRTILWKGGQQLVIFPHELLQEALGSEIAFQQLLARPWILLITFTTKTTVQRGMSTTSNLEGPGFSVWLTSMPNRQIPWLDKDITSDIMNSLYLPNALQKIPWINSSRIICYDHTYLQIRSYNNV